MLSVVKLLAGLVGVFWMAIAGGYAVWWWDRRPADVPQPVAFHVLFWPVKLGWPPSLKASLDGRDGLLRQAVANERTVTAALVTQNGRVRSLAAAGATARAEAETATAAYRSALVRASAPEVRIIAAGTGPGDATQRAETVDRLFLESLK
jgi:hypothetical protein